MSKAILSSENDVKEALDEAETFLRTKNKAALNEVAMKLALVGKTMKTKEISDRVRFYFESLFRMDGLDPKENSLSEPDMSDVPRWADGSAVRTTNQSTSVITRAKPAANGKAVVRPLPESDANGDEHDDSEEREMKEAMGVTGAELFAIACKPDAPENGILLKACEQLSLADATDEKEMLAAITALVQAGKTLNVQLQYLKLIMLTACVRRGLSERMRGKVTRHYGHVAYAEDVDIDTDEDTALEPSAEELRIEDGKRTKKSAKKN